MLQDNELKWINTKYKVVDSCWEWQGALHGSGYGMIRNTTKLHKKYNTQLAHRLSYCIFIGPIKDNYHICHTCDNRKCINPTHLFMGTNNDNVKDKCNKGRQKKKLSHEAVLAIRVSKLKGIDLAILHGVAPSVISQIRNRKLRIHE